MAKKGSKWTAADRAAQSRRIKLWHAARARENAKAKVIKGRAMPKGPSVTVVAVPDVRVLDRLSKLEESLVAALDQVKAVRYVVEQFRSIDLDT